jgi:hypothetical protein
VSTLPIPSTAARRHRQRRVLRYQGYSSCCGSSFADLVPLGLRADEHVRGRLERGRLVEGSVRHAKPHAVVMTDGPIHKAPALSTAHRVEALDVAVYEECLLRVVTLSLSGSISPHGRNAAPVNARQLEQWQLYAATN